MGVLRANGPAALEGELILLLRGADRRIHHAALVSSNAAGRNYKAVIPANTAVSLTVASAVADVFDHNGTKVTTELTTQAAAGAIPTVAAFTLHRKTN